jgi:glycosyltransferase involved in cell wall biosynthesis
MSGDLSLCAVIPVFNHSEWLSTIIDQFKRNDIAVIIVDDGSDASCRILIDALVEKNRCIRLERHEINQGKGAAIKTALRVALEQGFTHALQVDADGQHALDDISKFVTAMEKNPKSLIAGYPCYDDSIPRHRYYGRYASHIWVWINTLSCSIIDSMCGFRIYPLAQSVELISREKMGNRMDFDGEFIVRWFWTGQPIEQISTRVIYPPDGVSHFRLFSDNRLIAWMHTRLFFGMLLRLPRLLKRMWASQ